ncbi:MAG: hypothetical protein GY820_08595 [Gammaproteobacteria bacterium]|nr:hypothetical protein [Gammaproteobacteria bacterium]
MDIYRDAMYAVFASLQGCNLLEQCRKQLPRSKKPVVVFTGEMVFAAQKSLSDAS